MVVKAPRAPSTPQGILLFEPRVFRDDRGDFHEVYRTDRYAEAGIGAAFVQDNLSRSRQGVLRGMHLQHPRAQGKLIAALSGEIFDVAVDVRVGSPTFGGWSAFHLTASGAQQLYLPPGIAHGFFALTEDVRVLYKCTELYSPSDELTLRWDDPDIGIEWPSTTPILSKKDAEGLLLKDIPEDRLPRFDAISG
jgi:dTDP-4-dehydrorhamnose 3,5-epimerase